MQTQLAGMRAARDGAERDLKKQGFESATLQKDLAASRRHIVALEEHGKMSPAMRKYLSIAPGEHLQ